MKRILTLLLLSACTLCVCAEVVTLKTGTRIEGTILINNEEVVIIRDASGARFQYPKADVESIYIPEKKENTNSEAADPTTATLPAEEEKKVTLSLELAGGVASWPTDTTGGYMAANLIIGSRHIAGRTMLIGGGVGYLGEYMGGERYNFLPIQVVLRMPILEQKHAPMFGAGIGYAAGLSKDYRGGIYTGFDLGYLYTSDKGAKLYVGADLHFVQATVTRPETIDFTYSGTVGRHFLNAGAKLAVFF